MKQYTIQGPAGELTIQLDDEDAEARGLAGGKGDKSDKRAEVADKSFNKPAKKAT